MQTSGSSGVNFYGRVSADQFSGMTVGWLDVLQEPAEGAVPHVETRPQQRFVGRQLVTISLHLFCFISITTFAVGAEMDLKMHKHRFIIRGPPRMNRSCSCDSEDWAQTP